MEEQGTRDGRDRAIDALESLWELWENGTVAGLRHRLVNRVCRKHRLPMAVAEEIVGEAFDYAVRALSEGKAIANLGAWFYRVVDRCAGKRLDELRVLQDAPNDIGETLQSVPVTDEEMVENELRAQRLRDLALSHAANLAHCVGTGQIRDVFDLFLEAARNEFADGVPEMIADTLSIPVPQVRTLIHRALQRLKKAAADVGISLDLPDQDTG